ncbi:hypothetical protein [Pseudomonas sp. nanlin1]|uniref:hypothetical protein n=1 Tax=Pseudomonas sp. nanlin1 TaxID=3040605 RepID=UPI0038903331
MKIYLAGRVVRLSGSVFYLGLMLFFLLCLALWICVLYRQSQAEVAVSEFGRCKFHRVADGSKAFDLKLPKKQCHLVSYRGGSVIFMTVSYPDMEVLDYRKDIEGKSVSFWFVNESEPPVFIGFNSQGLPLRSVRDGVYEYGNTHRVLWRIVRATGENVSVYPSTGKNQGSWWVGQISATYQYDADIAGMIDMDDFAARFFQKLEIKEVRDVDDKNEQ